MALSPAPKTALLRQQLRSRRNRHLEDVEGHRHKRIIADETGQVDQPALAEALLDLFEQSVTHAMVLIESAAEIIDELLVGVGENRRAALGDRGDDLLGEPDLAGEPGMVLPFELCGPIARRHQDGDFGQPRRKIGAEPHMGAELVGVVGEPGAVEPDMRRRRDGVTRPGHDIVPHAALRLIQLAPLELSVSRHCRLRTIGPPQWSRGCTFSHSNCIERMTRSCGIRPPVLSSARMPARPSCSWRLARLSATISGVPTMARPRRASSQVSVCSRWAPSTLRSVSKMPGRLADSSSRAPRYR